jgi:predicted transcriptional regulator
MARAARPPLSPLEHEIMAVVWSHGDVVAEDVGAALGGRLKNASVRTLLRRIERKGYLDHRVEGRAFVYRPRVDSGAAARGAVRRVLDRFYGGSVERLLVGLLDGRMIERRQLAALEKRITQAEQQARDRAAAGRKR